MSEAGLLSTHSDGLPTGRGAAGRHVLEARGVSRHFRDNVALDQVDFGVRPGEIHALLGPNGAGKTTLVRLLTGLHLPSAGEVVLPGHGVDVTSRAARARMALVPSGERSFYNRISGFENLLFFGRLQGLRRGDAKERALACLELVGLSGAARRPVGQYSHGMQKRLSMARALLTDPEVLLVDEATHDLDPEGARTVRRLVADRARSGAAVVWTTQRVDEIRGFADRVTVLHQGRVRFAGTVSQLVATVPMRRIVLRVLDGDEQPVPEAEISAAVGSMGRVWREGHDDPEHFGVELRATSTVGDVVVALHQSGARVLACREETSEVEQALLHLTEHAEPAP